MRFFRKLFRRGRGEPRKAPDRQKRIQSARARQTKLLGVIKGNKQIIAELKADLARHNEAEQAKAGSGKLKDPKKTTAMIAELQGQLDKAAVELGDIKQELDMLGQ